MFVVFHDNLIRLFSQKFEETFLFLCKLLCLVDLFSSSMFNKDVENLVDFRFRFRIRINPSMLVVSF